MSRRDSLRAETGSAVITAMLVTLLILTLGATVLASVDVQSGQSRKQRERESTFQLSEGLLNAQVFQLSRRWPTEGTAYPASCSQASTGVADCPSAAGVPTAADGIDFRQTAWTTRVRDNGGGAESYYDAAIVEAQPTFDRNGDDRLWVRAEGLLVDPANPARFKRRVLVGLIRVDSREVTLPRAAVVANHIATGNHGAKTMVDTNGVNNEFLAGDVLLRCDGKPLASDCMAVDNSKQRKQLDPPTVVMKPPTPPTTFSTEALDQLRKKATAEGNYHAGCPTTLAGGDAGETVFIEDSGAGCSFQGSPIYNTLEKPGVVVIGRGAGLRLSGGVLFYGLIYHANLSNLTGYLVEMTGNASVIGSIQIAGAGGVYLQGSAKLVYNPNFLAQAKVFGTASMVQDSFRELVVTG